MKRDEMAAAVGARFTNVRGYDQAMITDFAIQQVNAALDEAEDAVKNLPLDGGIGYNIAVGNALDAIRALKIP